MKERERADRRKRGLGLCACVLVCMRVYYQLAEDRRPHVFFVCPVNIPSTERRMETDALRCSSAFFQTFSLTHTHTHTHLYTHILRKLPRLVAKSMSILLSLTSNWHIDWWWRAWRTAKWLLAKLQRERQKSSNLSKIHASVHSFSVRSNIENLQWLCLTLWEYIPIYKCLQYFV